MTDQTEPDRCSLCDEYRKIYTKTLCFDCAMIDEDTPDVPVVVPFSPAHVERLRLQVSHCCGQCEEALKARDFAKVVQLQASLEELKKLIPGGAK